MDGFVVPAPKEKIEGWKAMAGAIWKEYGALAFAGCLTDDVPFGASLADIYMKRSR